MFFPMLLWSLVTLGPNVVSLKSVRECNVRPVCLVGLHLFDIRLSVCLSLNICLIVFSVHLCLAYQKTICLATVDATPSSKYDSLIEYIINI